MNARDRYEKLGTQLLEELEALPEAHPLKKVFSTSKLYQAILRDDVRYPEFEGPETIFGVSDRYLMRFDFLLEWTSTTLNQGPRAGRVTELSGELRESRRELLDALHPPPKEVLQAVSARLAEFEALGLPLVEAVRLVITELLAGWREELPEKLSDLRWSMEDEFHESDESDFEELASRYEARLEAAIKHVFDQVAFLRFSRNEIGKVIDAVLMKQLDSR